MATARLRKCRHCGQLYEPDPRNRYHQRYCHEPPCRQASKTASQGRWRASGKGRNYFRGRANVLRVQAWRKAHPGYWRKRPKKSSALQDHCLAQVLVPPTDKAIWTAGALQDVLRTQGLALQGLIANWTGSALQEDIASHLHRLILLGQQIQGPSRGKRADERGQTCAVPGAIAARAPAVQLDRPPAGPG